MFFGWMNVWFLKLAQASSSYEHCALASSSDRYAKTKSKSDRVECLLNPQDCEDQEIKRKSGHSEKTAEE